MLFAVCLPKGQQTCISGYQMSTSPFMSDGAGGFCFILAMYLGTNSVFPGGGGYLVCKHPRAGAHQHGNNKQVIQLVVSCADEIDAIAPKRETAQREMERRIVAQMLTCMDDLSAPPPSAHQDLNADPNDPQLSTPGPAQQSDEQQNTAPSNHVVIIGKLSHLPSHQPIQDF